LASPANEHSIAILGGQRFSGTEAGKHSFNGCAGFFGRVPDMCADFANDFFPVGDGKRAEMCAEGGEVVVELNFRGFWSFSCGSSTGSSKLLRPLEKLNHASAMRRRRCRPASVRE